eukprot:TRINITY_DN18658_c0_g2_i1.p1 TRINITY_DN18658_c0_g2~~TRINITY_DN18658_c0_g2_i1.p1  ORF type:complete len:295 (+),score=73.53 TRINITY_DN18658_c0_g2_i1:55-939(+)
MPMAPPLHASLSWLQRGSISRNSPASRRPHVRKFFMMVGASLLAVSVSRCVYRVSSVWEPQSFVEPVLRSPRLHAMADPLAEQERAARLQMYAAASSEKKSKAKAKARKKPAAAAEPEAKGVAPSATPSGPKEKRPPIDTKQLKVDHGPLAQKVEAILRGKKADTPDMMMRARFSAVRTKDCIFLARTEEDEDKESEEERKIGWLRTLGKEAAIENFFTMLESRDAESLRDIDSFDLVEVEGDEVEFKIYCKNGKMLYERSKFKEHPKYGWVYTGDSLFGTWRDESPPSAIVSR